jgi:FdhD protein
VSAAQRLLRTAVRRVDGAPVEDEVDDLLAVEEPLEIRLGFQENGRTTHRAISITMRTPGEDAELAAGFLFTEGIVQRPEQIKQIRHCGLAIGKGGGALDRVSSLNSNTIRIDLTRAADVDLKRLDRHFYTTSSCGICGKTSIDALRIKAQKFDETDRPRIDAELVNGLSSSLRTSQLVFDQTGGLHASALFALDGTLDIVREDVGRHNALDKVIGAKFLNGEIPLNDRLLLVSGRASFELAQKALMAGIPVMAAVGAPSSLAVELAREFGMTLMGFVRDGRFNIYSGAERIVCSQAVKV